MTLNFHVEKDLDALFSYAQGPESQKANIAIRLAVANWSTRQNDCCCANLFYRIGQAFLSIFGKADWQVAIKTMRAAIFENINYRIKTLTSLIGRSGIGGSFGMLMVSQFNITEESLSDDARKFIDKIITKGLERLIKLNDKDFLENQPIDSQFSMEMGQDLTQFSGDLCKEFMPSMKLGFQKLQMARALGFGMKSSIDTAINLMQANGIDVQAWVAANPGPYNFNGVTPGQILNQVSPILGVLGIDAQRITDKVLAHLGNKHNINIQL